jgi:titin
VQGNRIGTTPDGTAALANGTGVRIDGGASRNIIGGVAPGAGNTISGNSNYGVLISGGGTASNLVQGNRIGTNADGTAALGNGTDGVRIDGGASRNTIGGDVPGAGNTISGNDRGAGVWIRERGTSGNQVQGNQIGTDAAGSSPLGNRLGLVISNLASGNTVGGTAAGAGNTISGNGVGVVIDASDNQVEGNHIGTNAAGTAALANFDGVRITSGAGNTIGGTEAGAGNTISGNTDDGVSIVASDDNQVVGNRIGTAVDGTDALANAYGVVVLTGASGNVIGGAAAGAGNTISGNSQYGVWISGESASGNRVEGNRIGTTPDGTAALGNGTDGVLIEGGASGNTVGGAAPGAGNTISGNPSSGVTIRGGGTTANRVQGNRIGTKADATAPLPNGFGVAIEGGASDNTIGGTGAGASNTISGNSQDGIEIDGSGTTGNLIQGNAIGTTGPGTARLGNSRAGVVIKNGASNNTVGGAGAGNVIAYNQGAGVQVGAAEGDSTAVGNAILANAIFDNGALGIDLGGDGVTPNTPGGPHTGPNDFQNYPVLAASNTPGTVTGLLNSAPHSAFHLEFFANPSADPSGYGQGRDFLGELTVTTNALGNAVFTFQYTPFPGEPFLTATATDAAGNTSEFSAAVNAAPTGNDRSPSVTEGAAEQTLPGWLLMRAQVVEAVFADLASRLDLVDGDHQRFGNSTADGSGWNAFENALGSGTTAQDIMSAISRADAHFAQLPRRCQIQAPGSGWDYRGTTNE